MKLYELSNNYQNLLDLIDNEEVPFEMLTEALNSVKDDFKTKAEATGKILLMMEMEAEIIKVEEKRLEKKRKAIENKHKHLKEYLYHEMKTTGITDIKSPLISLKIQGCKASVEVVDESLIPTKYFIPKFELSKTMLMEDLAAGLEIAGARIKENESLRIK